MKNFSIARPIWIWIVAAVSLMVAGCGMFVDSPPQKLSAYKAVVPVDFLFSWDESYNDWMNTPTRVLIFDKPLKSVFEGHPFTRLSYEIRSLPMDSELVNIDAMGLTRRQLLWAISHDYKLKMTLRTNSEGHPEAIVIESREKDQSKVTTKLK